MAEMAEVTRRASLLGRLIGCKKIQINLWRVLAACSWGVFCTCSQAHVWEVSPEPQPGISPCRVLQHLHVQAGQKGQGPGQGGWPDCFPCAPSWGLTLAQRAAYVLLGKSDPSASLLWRAQQSALLKKRRREMSPSPCSQPFPSSQPFSSSCQPTGQHKQLSTSSGLERDDSGLDLVIWS